MAKNKRSKKSSQTFWIAVGSIASVALSIFAYQQYVSRDHGTSQTQQNITISGDGQSVQFNVVGVDDNRRVEPGNPSQTNQREPNGDTATPGQALGVGAITPETTGSNSVAYKNLRNSAPETLSTQKIGIHWGSLPKYFVFTDIQQVEPSGQAKEPKPKGTKYIKFMAKARSKILIDRFLVRFFDINGIEVQSQREIIFDPSRESWNVGDRSYAYIELSNDQISKIRIYSAHRDRDTHR